jgi:aspartyl-tRNA(Asn)/glutamyl-tRNA(Gln) amidotransferase subunit A
MPSPNLIEIATQVQAGALTARTVVERSLAQAARVGHLNAFLSLSSERALEAADALDARVRAGDDVGKLAGVPVAIKDALCTYDAPTTAASRMLTRDGKTHASGWVPAYDATAVARLRAAGAIPLGKANMDEFAMGSSTENSAFGPARNPWDPERIPGGSSGGSAVAVAAGVTPAALGSDTGGSIRQPAALCGVVGVKPSYGRVSRFGLVAFASSLDQIGPFASDVRSAARVLEVIAGPDIHDSTCATHSVGAYERACERGVKGLRVGIPKEYFAEGLDDEVRHGVVQLIDALRAQGATICEVSLPHTQYGVATYYVVATAEASSNLSRFDGVRFGLRVEDPKTDLLKMYARSRDQGFGPEVKRRIMLGTYALSSGYYDAYYKKAQQVRTLIKGDFDAAFQTVDVLVTPSTPTVAFRLGEKANDPVKMYLADVYTLPASLAGICGLSVPAALAGNLPIGAQMLAPAFAEEQLFAAAAAWEDVSPVKHRVPAIQS